MAREARKLDNWLQGYHEFIQGTESLPIFHAWVALGTLAGAAQRKTYLDLGFFQIHTNMFIVLVSRPGVGRKSTALRIGKALLKGATDHGVQINFSTQASSVAALIQQLSQIQNMEHQSLTSYSSEIGSLLGSKSDEATNFLTDIYDCNPDWDKQTVGRGLEKITKPWFNLVGATTPQWLGENLSPTAVEGGFAARTIFVFGDDVGQRVAIPEMSPEQRQLQRDLIHDLAIIGEIEGEFRLSSDARKVYTEWYENPETYREQEDYRLTGYYERKHIQVLKLAMMVRLAHGHVTKPEHLVIEVPDIIHAMRLLEDIEPGMYRAFAAVGKNEYSTDIERIREQITRLGKATYKQLLNANIAHIEREELDKILQTLTALGDIRRSENGLFISLMGGD